jgi:PhnB protein
MDLNTDLFFDHQGQEASTVDTPGEAERIFNVLAEGGSVAMPLAETFFAHRFGMLTGTPWMVACGKQQGARKV